MMAFPDSGGLLPAPWPVPCAYDPPRFFEGLRPRSTPYTITSVDAGRFHNDWLTAVSRFAASSAAYRRGRSSNDQSTRR